MWPNNLLNSNWIGSKFLKIHVKKIPVIDKTSGVGWGDLEEKSVRSKSKRKCDVSNEVFLLKTNKNTYANHSNKIHLLGCTVTTI